MTRPVSPFDEQHATQPKQHCGTTPYQVGLSSPMREESQRDVRMNGVHPDRPGTANAVTPRRRMFTRILNNAWFKGLVSASFLYHVFRSVDGEAVAEQIATIPVWVWAPVLCVAALEVTLSAYRFKTLVAPVCHYPLKLSIRNVLLGRAMNHVLPSSIGGDAYRIYDLYRTGKAGSHSITALVLERVFGLMVTLLFAGTLGLAADLQPPLDGVCLGAATAALLLLSLMIAALGLPLVDPRLSRLRQVLAPWRQHRQQAAKAGVLGFGSQAASITLTIVIGRALGLDLSLAMYFCLVPLSFLVIALPVGLGGIGTREVAFIWLFGTAGVHADTAVALSLGTALSLLPAGIAGAAFLWKQPFALKSGRYDADTKMAVQTPPHRPNVPRLA